MSASQSKFHKAQFPNRRLKVPTRCAREAIFVVRITLPALRHCFVLEMSWRPFIFVIFGWKVCATCSTRILFRGWQTHQFQPLSLTPFVVFQRALPTSSLSYLRGNYSFFSLCPSHSPVPWLVSWSPSRSLAFFPRAVPDQRQCRPRCSISGGNLTIVLYEGSIFISTLLRGY